MRELALIVADILRLARALDMSIIAEGVETEDEETHLGEAGCDSAQGFRYGMPIPAATLVHWMSGTG